MPGKIVTWPIQNSRCDKVWTSGMWKRLIAEQRVLAPINSFYEWKQNNGKLLSTSRQLPDLPYF